MNNPGSSCGKAFHELDKGTFSEAKGKQKKAGRIGLVDFAWFPFD